MLIDSHCHFSMLDLSPYDGDLDACVQAARDAGVKRFLNISVSLENAKEVIAQAEKYDDVYASVGVHPSDVNMDVPSVEALLELADHPKVIGFGETGLDYYYNEGDYEPMKQSFRHHIRAALKAKKPLIIHTRAAQQDTLSILREENAAEIGGVFHCFTESAEMALAGIGMNFFVSFSGIVTFKNADNVRQAAEAVPLDKMLVETDSPYLAPVPKRGKKNEPQYVQYVAEYLADLKGVSYAELCAKTGENFFTCFRLKNAVE